MCSVGCRGSLSPHEGSSAASSGSLLHLQVSLELPDPAAERPERQEHHHRQWEAQTVGEAQTVREAAVLCAGGRSRVSTGSWWRDSSQPGTGDAAALVTLDAHWVSERREERGREEEAPGGGELSQWMRDDADRVCVCVSLDCQWTVKQREWYSRSLHPRVTSCLQTFYAQQLLRRAPPPLRTERWGLLTSKLSTCPPWLLVVLWVTQLPVEW